MKTAIITGANKGIGFETARQLAQKGYHIFLCARDTEKGKKAVQQLQQEGLHATFVQLDVSSGDSIHKAFEFIRSQTGKVDVLINNAGIRGTGPQNATAISIDNVRHVFNTNFFGMIEVTQACMPLLKLSDAPRIVNVTSDLASLTKHNDPTWKYYGFKGAAYGPSKTAMNAYTVSLAYELRDTNFKVNAVNPGYTKTDFNNHMGTKPVEEAAQLLVQFATLDAKGPTGKFFGDGGETAW